jgi:manganese/zinc/iron transport system ATP- binding protein
VDKYFDQVLLLNMRLVAFGPLETVFNRENLHAAYGGRLNLLTDVAGKRADAESWLEGER